MLYDNIMTVKVNRLLSNKTFIFVLYELKILLPGRKYISSCCEINILTNFRMEILKHLKIKTKKALTEL